MKTTEIGRLGEKISAKYLKKNGYKILARNRHQSHNELDIIAVDKNYIVFVEVKTRSVKSDDLFLPYGTPSSAVTHSKKMRTVAAANNYLSSNKNSIYAQKQPRMDVIEVYLDKDTQKALKINHIIDAFGSR